MVFKSMNKGGADTRERSLWAGLLSLGLVFPIAIVLGYYIGRWVGGMVGNPRAGGLIGLGWGVTTGFWELFKVAKRLEKYDAPANTDEKRKAEDENDADSADNAGSAESRGQDGAGGGVRNGQDVSGN